MVSSKEKRSDRVFDAPLRDLLAINP